ncbi:sodium- and chloride-dependent neutral and basic amino acid transporter B(0+)-like [Pristis pectinata]|uniref:sodium- and chloride-dependent neutral and basic amino acid transporter B(0+)-like n=1 Tax=Pristis pectinata TaxID=685728 RepID=UPI00223E3E7D|nr:sodium- and chloride-dependent neutral and basic amino acid transporter B(0+)-like [Pristis pectinata]
MAVMLPDLLATSTCLPAKPSVPGNIQPSDSSFGGLHRHLLDNIILAAPGSVSAACCLTYWLPPPAFLPSPVCPATSSPVIPHLVVSIATSWTTLFWQHQARSLQHLPSNLPSLPQQDNDEYFEPKDENLVRGNWSLKADYMLSVVGFTLGLGNLWRFPYLAYKNGGGAFLIPYTIMMAIAGVPLVFLESALGQSSSLGPLKVWKVDPILQGLGVLSVILSILQTIYYNIIISCNLFYLFSSFHSFLPWADCFSWWGRNESCAKGNVLTSCAQIITKSASEVYWDEKVLRRSSSIDHIGKLNWDLALCLLLAWLMVFVAVSKGIKSSGKVVYFTMTFPYFGLILLLIQGATLDGADKGIDFYFGSHSDFSKLADAEVWKDAATQTFYSLSVSLGGLMALSSYNKFHNDCYTDAISICIIDDATSVFAGLAIFSILGHLTHDTNVPVSEVTHSGFGLAFIICPEALPHLPISPFRSIIFFCTLIALGLSSQSVLVGNNCGSTESGFSPAVKKALH